MRDLLGSLPLQGVLGQGSAISKPKPCEQTFKRQIFMSLNQFKGGNVQAPLD